MREEGTARQHLSVMCPSTTPSPAVSPSTAPTDCWSVHRFHLVLMSNTGFITAHHLCSPGKGCGGLRDTGTLLLHRGRCGGEELVCPLPGPDGESRNAAAVRQRQQNVSRHLPRSVPRIRGKPPPGLQVPPKLLQLYTLELLLFVSLMKQNKIIKNKENQSVQEGEDLITSAPP